MGGGEFLDLVGREHHRPWSAPNLTTTERGLALWSEQDLADYLKTARNDMLESFGPMNEVIINSTRYLESQDIEAMVTYLKSLPAVPERQATAPDPEIMGRGRTIYNFTVVPATFPPVKGTLTWHLVWIAAVWLCRTKTLPR